MAELIKVTMMTRADPDSPFVPVDVIGEVVAPGLAITPATNPTGDGFHGGWTLTHTASGYSISPGALCLNCIRDLIEADLPDIDWTRDGEAIKADAAAADFGREWGAARADCSGWSCR